MVLPELGQPNHAQHREYQILTKLVHLNQPVGEVECGFTTFTPFSYHTSTVSKWYDTPKPIFHFKHRSIFHCFVNTQAELMTWTQKNTFRFATTWLK